MKFKAKINKFQGQLWGHHIPVPNDIAEEFLKDKNRRVILKINSTNIGSCALMPDGKSGWFININKEVRKKFKIEEGSEINAELEADTSKYGMPMPEEMQELLEIDIEGGKIFHALTPGKQRSLLHLIGKPKQTDTRLRKAIIIVDYLKSVNGKLDFKELHTAIKARKNDELLG